MGSTNSRHTSETLVILSRVVSSGMSSKDPASTLKEIAFYAHKDRAAMLLIPKRSMSNVIKSMVTRLGMAADVTRVSAEAYALLHEMTECYLVGWFQMLYSHSPSSCLANR
jgi:histone H3/H4